MDVSSFRPGLEGVVAGETSISTLASGLHYRGYDIRELARYASFEETAYLLLRGELPTAEELQAFRRQVSEIALQAAAIDRPDHPFGSMLNADRPAEADSRASFPAAPLLTAVLKQLAPDLPMIDWLRTAASLLADGDPEPSSGDRDAHVRKATRLLVQMPLVLAATHRRFSGVSQRSYDPARGLAANLLCQLLGKEVDPAVARAFEVSMIVYADHEFNASTFTARVVASTGSDLHSAIVAAIGALKGPLHGGANERVVEVLLEVGTPARADTWVREAIASKRRITGFGHRTCKDGDVRAVLLKPLCVQLAERSGLQALEQTADAVEQAMLAQRGLHPNVDWPVARLYHYLGLPSRLNPALFLVSRIAGWCAHVIEQQTNNRLISPRAHYVGPAMRAFVPVENRIKNESFAG